MALRLTEKEKTVFIKLIENPYMNDAEIAEETKIIRRTVTAIRVRFEKEKLYTTINVPNFPAIGCEIIAVAYGNFNPLIPFEKRMEKHSKSKIIPIPELAYILTTDTKFIVFALSKNFTELKKITTQTLEEYEKSGVIEKINIVNFPFTLTEIPCFFEFSGLLRDILHQDNDGKKRTTKFLFKEISTRRLTLNEKKVMYALVKYPEMNDREISEKVSINRVTVSNIKKRLIKEKIMQTIRLPDVRKLDCEIIALFSVKFNPRATLENRGKISMKVLEENPSITSMFCGNNEGADIRIFKNYTDFETSYTESIKIPMKSNILAGEPDTLIIPTAKIRFTKLDFAPLTKKLLELDADF